MKKLLVLMVVMGIASLATAGIEIVPGLEYEVVGSTLNINATTAVQTIGWSLQADDGSLLSNSTVAAGLSTGKSNGQWNNATYLPNGLLGISGNIGTGSAVTGTIYSVDFASTAQTITFLYAQYTPSQVVFEGGVVVGLTDKVMTVPEPATLALLGLGALVLRRRK